MKLRSEMLELKLFWFLRQSRSRRWKRRETSFDVSKPEKTPSCQPSIGGVPAICERFLLHAHHSSRANNELNDMIELKLEDQLDNLSTELMKSNGELQEHAYELSNQMSELQHKYKAVANYQDAELARSASKARKEVKGRGMELIQGAIVFIKTEKARMELESDIKKYESNLLLLDQTHEDDFLKNERGKS
ncbi:hypothetical protein AtNW77_Chr3g0195761 [Arabidopsis thaliana]